MSSNPQSLILILQSLLFNLNFLLLLLRSLLFSLSGRLFQLLLLTLLLTWPHLLSQCPPTIHHFLTTQACPLPVTVPGPLHSMMAASTISSFLGYLSAQRVLAIKTGSPLTTPLFSGYWNQPAVHCQHLPCETVFVWVNIRKTLPVHVLCLLSSMAFVTSSSF